MAVACSPGGGPNDSRRGRVRLVERISAGVVAWCADGEAEYRDPEHIFHGESFCCAGPEQTAEFVRSGYERVIRWAIIAGLLAFAALGYAAFCRGIEAVEARKALVPMQSPDIGPLPAMPPIDSGGCVYASTVHWVGGRR